MKTQINHVCNVFVLGKEDSIYPFVLFVIPKGLKHGLLRLYDKTNGMVSMNETVSVDVVMTRKDSNRKLTLTLHPSRPYELETMRLIWSELVEFGGYTQRCPVSTQDILTESERMAFEVPYVV